jgi:hypothetical protein
MEVGPILNVNKVPFPGIVPFSLRELQVPSQQAADVLPSPPDIVICQATNPDAIDEVYHLS